MAYDSNNVFARILRREIPARVVYEDDRCLAFHDTSPQAPVHVLLVPKAPIAKLADATAAERDVLGHLLWACGEVARKLGVADDGFRVVINNGAGAQQTVFHLHLHLLAGRPFHWPPG
ncbi:MAG TPA: histidine triad nucleotide-binding protein [Planctomycetota bacterium]|nr:histidine triad nucleotide-binding protein [Planctomycetota bacterium]